MKTAYSPFLFLYQPKAYWWLTIGNIPSGISGIWRNICLTLLQGPQSGKAPCVKLWSRQNLFLSFRVSFKVNSMCYILLSNTICPFILPFLSCFWTLFWKDISTAWIRVTCLSSKGGCGSSTSGCIDCAPCKGTWPMWQCYGLKSQLTFPVLSPCGLFWKMGSHYSVSTLILSGPLWLILK